MPNKKVILPIAAGLVLLAMLWFAFRDNSADDPVSKPAPVARPVASTAAVPAGEPIRRGRFVVAVTQGGSDVRA